MPQLASTARERDGTDTRVRPDGHGRDRGDACPGALRLHPADDGALARVRVPAGLLTSAQARALAGTAELLGDGHIDVTSRGNLQLRGLDGQKSAELAARLDAAGLLPSPRHDRVRNVVASPLSGLDGHGHADVRPWAAQLDELLLASDDATALSGRFLFAFDDGRGDTAGLEADVTLIALPGGREVLLRVAGTAAVLVPAEHAPDAALLAAEAFLSAVRESGATVWRVSELPDGGEQFALRVAHRLRGGGVPVRPVAGVPPLPAASAPAPGVVEGPAGRCSLYVLARLGRLTAEQLHRLASLSEQRGNGVDGAAKGELRVTPWRGVVVPGLPAAEASARLRELRDAGLVTGADSPWHGVSACTGLPGCARSHRDVRSDAALAPGPDTAASGSGAPAPEPAPEPAPAPAPAPPAETSLLPVHFSGCERRCGRPKGDVVDVVAGGNGYTVAVQAEGSTRERAVPDGELAHAVASARAGRE
ncbi:precorrin-3B synthase [Streptomyces sp. WMMB 714]|uniref:precorrin-3B synthase n=1 Tax=Streptomyces sp. WMMB 714 TaxID=1286822 RepID=UPI0015862FB1|nr:precorrin-3B synthase [Streptomyces sp. WMMB 714]